MTDFRIRRCHIKAWRAAGAGASWSTREDRIALGRRVQRLVLGALDELLAANWQGPDDVHISQPLAVELPVKMSDLLVPAPLARQRLREPLMRALSEQIAAKVAQGAQPSSDNRPGEISVESDAAKAGQTIANVDHVPPRTLTLLAQWLRAGDLGRQLRFFDDAAIEAWYLAVERELRAHGAARVAAVHALGPHTSGENRAATFVELDSFVHEARSALKHRKISAGREALECRLYVLARLEERGFSADSRWLEAIESCLPLPKEHAPTPLDDVEVATTDVRDRSAALSRSVGSQSAEELLLGTFHVESVLPFLLLGPLRDSSWLATLDAMLRAARMPDTASALAFALALKSLPPPARGWHHKQSELDCAALFSGTRHAASGAQIEVVSRQIASHLGPLNGAVASSLLGGHSEDWPFIVAGHAGRVALFELQGLSPLTIANTADELISRLGGERLTCFVTREQATPALLQKLNAANWQFIAIGEPARGESWDSCISTRGTRALTNIPRSQRDRWRLRIDDCIDASERTNAVLHALIEARPLSATASASSLNDSMSLAAALALGEIGWRLAQSDWKSWADPDPVLALDRFGSLSGRIHFRDQSIEVVLPLGARFRDLRAARLLDNVPNVPWFAGRPVSFQGG